MMNEPKLLPPSMRSHKRYVVFEIISEKPVDYNDFVSAFWATFLNFMGRLQSHSIKKNLSAKPTAKTQAATTFITSCYGLI